MSATALSDLGEIVHLKELGWLKQKISCFGLYDLIISTYLMVPVLWSISGSMTTPFSEYLEMLKTARAIAHEMNTEASANTRPTNLRISPRLRQWLWTYQDKCWSKLVFNIILTFVKQLLPAPKSKAGLSGVHLRLWAHKSLRNERHWVMIDFRVVVHLPIINNPHSIDVYT